MTSRFRKPEHIQNLAEQFSTPTSQENIIKIEHNPHKTTLKYNTISMSTLKWKHSYDIKLQSY